MKLNLNLNKDVTLFGAVLVTLFAAQVASFTPNATVRNEVAPMSTEAVALAAPIEATVGPVARLEPVVIVAHRHVVAANTWSRVLAHVGSIHV